MFLFGLDVFGSSFWGIESFFFYENGFLSLVALATKSLLTYIVEIKNGIYCQAIADILANFYRNVS